MATEKRRGRLHELLAAEGTVAAAADKLFSETNEKLNKFTEFFTGAIRTLKRVNDSVADQQMEAAARKEKAMPSNVPDTMEYFFQYLGKWQDLLHQKHNTNTMAQATVTLDGKELLRNVPVDYLLDLEKLLPRLRGMFEKVPTLDPSRVWVPERKGVWKTKDAVISTQTERVTTPVVLYEATKEHPAQVKEVPKDIVVGSFSDIFFSGAITTQQKADVLALCDRLIVAVKEARMRANSVEVVEPTDRFNSISALFMEALTRE